nr:MAG TPA: hypothetical protein [Caudoviricetes sp.]
MNIIYNCGKNILSSHKEKDANYFHTLADVDFVMLRLNSEGSERT